MRTIQHAATSLALILIVALGMRVLMTRNYIHLRPRQSLAVLPFLFESGNIAHSLAAGKGFGSPFRVSTGPTAWMTPVYPLLLAGVIRLFGAYTYQAYLGAVSLNILFSTLVCVPLFYVGKRIGGAQLGALAAWLWAVFPNANLLTFESLWDASLDALLGALILWATLALAAGQRHTRDWCGYGLLCGLALMTNPVVGLLLPFWLAWIAYCQWKRGSIPVGRITLAAGIAILCCIPWTIRNYEVFHAFVPLRSVMGLQLWQGNNEKTTPVFLGTQHPIFNSAERDKYIEMGEIPYMEEKRALALDFMVKNPARVLELTGRRFLSVWSGGTSYPARDFLRTHSLWFRYVLLFNLLAAVGALSGIVILWRSHSEYIFPLAAAPLVFPLPYYLTLVEPRYRLPIDPIVLLFLAIALRTLFGLRFGESSPAARKKISPTVSISRTSRSIHQ